jgi:hypothetical protein
MRRLIWPAMLAIALGACSTSEGGSDGQGSPSTSGSQPPAASPGVGTLPASILDPVTADAAKRAGVDPSAVTVVRAEPRTWGDASLGCPQPGMFYTQVQVDGYQVIVSAGGTEYDYRAGAGRFLVCQGAKPSF